MSTQVPQFVALPIGKKTRIAIAAARFNADIVDELLAGCLARLAELGVADDRIEVVRVPGAFELPVTAKAFARTGRFSAIICLGAVVRGETPHFEYVAGEAARGLQDVAIWENLPVIFGVLTTNTREQALDRIGGKHGHAGQRSAEVAVEMIGVLESIAAAKKTKGKRK
jgi:6,7-dimethyl-8-ribityllumazine synthase